MTSHQAALLLKAKDSLDAATLLLEQGYSDFAASRAYYAMFYLAEALLLSKGLAFSKHFAVIGAFGREFAKTGEVPAEYHRYLIEAQDSRNAADYDPQPGLSEEEAGEQIHRAKEFLELACRLIGTPSPEDQEKS